MWRKSSYCNGSSGCVEFAEMADGTVALRDSKVEGGPVLAFTAAEWVAFLRGVRAGEFDALTVDAPSGRPASTGSDSGAVSVHG